MLLQNLRGFLYFIPCCWGQLWRLDSAPRQTPTLFAVKTAQKNSLLTLSLCTRKKHQPGLKLFRNVAVNWTQLFWKHMRASPPPHGISLSPEHTECSNISLLWSLILPAFRGFYTCHDSPSMSQLQVHHTCCGNPGIMSNTEEMIQVGSLGNSDERETQDTQTSTKDCHNSLGLRFSRKQRLLKKKLKKKKAATFKDFKRIFQRKLSRKTSFPLEKEILSPFALQIQSAKDKTSQRE